jgi:hypothetical protein
LVAQRLAAIVAARSFLGIELDRFHCSTCAYFGCSQALIPSTPGRGIWREGIDHLPLIIHRFPMRWIAQQQSPSRRLCRSATARSKKSSEPK